MRTAAGFFAWAIGLWMVMGPVPGICGEETTGMENRWLDAYRIVWTMQSENSTGSMPLGGGSIGLNVWVENNEILFYIGNPDSHNEVGELVKLGRVRMSATPNPFANDFRQELDLAQSAITISGKTAEGARASVRLWVDAFEPVVHAEWAADQPIEVRAAFESWPDVKSYMKPQEAKDTWGWKPRFQVSRLSEGLEWHYRLDPALYHRMAEIRRHGMEKVADTVPDLGRDLTYGGCIVAAGLIDAGATDGEYMKTPFRAWRMKTADKIKKLDMRIALRVEQDPTLEDWQRYLERLSRKSGENPEADFNRTTAWWKEFWNRSYIVINPGTKSDAAEKAQAWCVGRNYQLFRYMLACNRTGKFPTRFNGGIFTFDTPDYPALWDPPPAVRPWGMEMPDPDNRTWGSTLFMAQNQRLLYWPLLKTGDFDVMRPGLDFYRDRTDAQRARAQVSWGIDGAPFPEAISWLGLVSYQLGVEGGHCSAIHLVHHYTTAVEYAYMMLEYGRFSGVDIGEYLPPVIGVLTYYDQYYRRLNKQRAGQELDERGKLVIYPSCAVELYQGCKNNTDVISGLMAVSDGLLALPEEQLSLERRKWVEEFRKSLPAISLLETGGIRQLAVADSYETHTQPTNMEFPQLYAVFPFDRYGMGMPDLETARNTWRHGHLDRDLQTNHICWYQSGIFTARLGLTDEAKEYALKKFLDSGLPPKKLYPVWPLATFGTRFPAFWNTFPFDHPPDMDHGGSAMIGLQEMLMQTPGRKILLLPAWPEDWDCDFKLHAPFETVVEGSVRGGKIAGLKVQPSERRKDVVIIADETRF